MNRSLMAPWPELPWLRMGLAACAIAYGAERRGAIGCGDWIKWAMELLLPLLAIQGVVALVSLVLAVVALVRRDLRCALMEGGTASAMLAAVPVALWVNAVATPACQW